MTGVLSIVDVTVRDALQRVLHFVPTAEKARLARLLAGAGFQRLEVTAFRPDGMAQFADGANLLRELSSTPGIAWRALCYHAQGTQAALDAGAREIVLNVGTTDAFEARFHRTVADALHEALQGAAVCRAAGVPFVPSISHGLGARLDDAAWEALVRVTDPLVEAGANAITLADTGGQCEGETAGDFYSALATRTPGIPVALHFHHGRTSAITHLLDSLLAGCPTFEVGLALHAAPLPGDNACPLDVLDALAPLPLSLALNREMLVRAHAMLCAIAAGMPITG